MVIALLLAACGHQSDQRLPYLGERRLVETTVNGQTVLDTVYHTIGEFAFVDQDSAIITNETVSGAIYVADFFFTSCRTICPIMKTQMLRVYDSIQDLPDVLLLSHTIDPEYDTVGLLHDFASRLGVKSAKWHFLTGDKDEIYSVAAKGYFATAMEAPDEPDGFIHSGAFLLIDKQGHIRGKYDGTQEDDVNRLIRDINRLRKEDNA